LRNQRIRFVFIVVLLLFMGFGCGEKSLVMEQDAAIKAAQHYLGLTAEMWKGLPHLGGETLTVDKAVPFSEPGSDKPLGYLVHLKPLGFILTSAHSHIRPIIAYSFHGNFPLVEDPENMMLYLLREDLKKRIAYLDTIPQSVKDDNHNLWRKTANKETNAGFSFQSFPPASYESPTSGWVKTAWRQADPYNKYCPMDNTEVKRSLTGCVATSMTQIVNYWADTQDRLVYVDFTSDGDPTNNVGDDYISSRKNDDTGGMVTIEIDEQAQIYDFPQFQSLNQYLMTLNALYKGKATVNGEMAAGLFFACGVAVKMHYTADGSASTNERLKQGLLDKFNYFSADKINYNNDPDAFINTLASNNMNAQPAALGITKNSHGHSIVCDGYRQMIFATITLNAFHLNYGWGTDSPEEITHCWWLPPGKLPKDWVLKTGVLNILPPPVPKTEKE